MSVSTLPAGSKQQKKLDDIIERAHEGQATPGAIDRLEGGNLYEAAIWLRASGLDRLARDVEDLRSDGVF